MDCPNCHCRNLGKSSAQALGEVADRLQVEAGWLQQEAWDRRSEGWDEECARLEWDATTYRTVAEKVRGFLK